MSTIKSSNPNHDLSTSKGRNAAYFAGELEETYFHNVPGRFYGRQAVKGRSIILRGGFYRTDSERHEQAMNGDIYRAEFARYTERKENGEFDLLRKLGEDTFQLPRTIMTPKRELLSEVECESVTLTPEQEGLRTAMFATRREFGPDHPTAFAALQAYKAAFTDGEDR